MSKASARSRSEPLTSSTPRASACRIKSSSRSEASASRKVKFLCFMSSRMVECEYRAVLAPPVSYSVNREKMGPWGGQSVAAPPDPVLTVLQPIGLTPLQAADEWLRCWLRNDGVSGTPRIED